MNADDLKKAYAKLPGKRIYHKLKDKNITPETDPGAYVLKFGKYKNTRIQDIPVEYLNWFIVNVTSRPDIVELMKRYLNFPQEEKKPRTVHDLLKKMKRENLRRSGEKRSGGRRGALLSSL